MNYEVRRPEKRVFGKDITNTYIGVDKNEKIHGDKNLSLQLKYIPNVKPA